MVPVFLVYIVLFFVALFWFFSLIEDYSITWGSWVLFLGFVAGSVGGLVYDYQKLGVTQVQKEVFFVEDVAVIRTGNSLLELSKRTGQSYKAGDKVELALIDPKTEWFDWCMSYNGRIKTIEKVK